MTTYISAMYSGNWGVMNGTGRDIATYRAHCLWIHNAILGCGLIQTSDTGQTDFTTLGGAISTTTANQTYGYTVYRFNDVDQGTLPVYLKVEWGTGAGTMCERLVVRVGNATNGAGTISGSPAVITAGGNNNFVGTMTSIQAYSCHTRGFFSLFVGPGNNLFGFPLNALTIARTRNSSEAFDGLGIIAWGDGGGGSSGASTAGQISTTRILDNVSTYAASDQYCLPVGYPSSSALLNGDLQLYPHFYALPDIFPHWAQFTVRSAEFTSTPVTFTATPFGTTARTFLFLGTSNAPVANVGNSSSFRLASLWE